MISVRPDGLLVGRPRALAWLEATQKLGHRVRGLPGARGWALRYGVALGVTAGSIGIRDMLSPLLGVRLLAFYPAVMLSAFWGGLGPGLLSTALGAIATGCFWSEAGGAAAGSKDGMAAGLSIVVVLGLLISLLHEALFRALAGERALRATAEQLALERTAVLAVVSHDLRNPLNAIGFGMDMLRKLTPEGESGLEARRGIDRVMRSVERMDRLIGDLLDASSLQAGRLSLEPATYDAAVLADEAIELFAHEAHAKGILLALEGIRRPLLVVCDRNRVLQLLSNLLGNALKFTPTGGQVDVRVERDGDAPMALFSVTDSGVGLPRSQHEQVFERYWKSKREAGGGTGLGLHIARGIAEAHGGKSWVESEPGRGCTFFFTLPLHVAGAPRGHDMASPPRPG